MTAAVNGSARLLIIGPQGSGKGTQGVHIATSFDVPAIATGDVFRANISAGTELGRRVRSVVDAGELVSDELTGDLVRDRLSQPDAVRGFLLDGYPRNVAQAAQLDAFLSADGHQLDAVIALNVPRAESVRRLSQRAVEQGRADDTEALISRRLEIYDRETKPMLDQYRERGIVVETDGIGTLTDVTTRILDGLAERGIVAD
ncbi:MAG: adenylate kinase [Candidatus Lumbricidophila eiseniae]|uniref:Adenylate kinase n=1 Tax=Candidatus Lumbricidiphila eiseniae TaxID=1969409 RepID=A0A2A6FSK5_9MICO|nr:MAG: adenylate kinase [Candidatus Lumbricidophila eiseniae]